VGPVLIARIKTGVDLDVPLAGTDRPRPVQSLQGLCQRHWVCASPLGVALALRGLPGGCANSRFGSRGPTCAQRLRGDFVADGGAFEEQRVRLWDIAYRITASVADADDVLQEAWLRWQRLPDGYVVDAGPFLRTVVSRICYDMIGSARARREVYTGPWLPEPLVTEGGPEDRVTLDDTVSLAMLTVLQRLTPAERTAFILHDVFAVPFAEIAESVGRTPAAVRQLASRARRRVREEAPRQSADRSGHQQAVEAFLAASTGGDLARLLEILDPDVVWRSDGGGIVTAARRPIVGHEKTARFVLGILQWVDLATIKILRREVNGAPGLVFLDSSGLTVVLAFTVHDGCITEIDAVVNPDKLRHLKFQE